MEDFVKMEKIPSFGSWEFCDELPITQYFDARQAVLLHSHFFGDEADLFEVPPYYAKVMAETEKQKVGEESQQQQSRKRRAPRAVDEDLYKVPNEFMYQKKQKKRMVLSDFWKRCFGLICIP